MIIEVEIKPDARGFVVPQGYVQTVTITNKLGATVEATIRPGSTDRYAVSPSTICLKPGKSVDVDVRLRVLKYVQKKKAVEQGVRDIFHIKVRDPWCAMYMLGTTAAPAL